MINSGYVHIHQRPPQGPWIRQAACTDADPGHFFISDKAETYAVGRQICAACSVRLECLEWALTANETEGLWGGLSPRQRDILSRRRRESGHLGNVEQLAWLLVLIVAILILLRIVGVQL